MQRELIITKDGSHTVAIPSMQVTYHSHHGALQESRHVFIEAGLHYILDKFDTPALSVFEMGLGTGLNALLTLIESETTRSPIQYFSIEKFPLTKEEAKELNYCRALDRLDLQLSLDLIHACSWEEKIAISPRFSFYKSSADLSLFSTSQLFHLIYFDAFAPSAQPEVWSKQIFEMLNKILYPGGILVTYCSKTVVRKAMKEAGFLVTKIPGPYGKRDMVRAIKS